MIESGRRGGALFLALFGALCSFACCHGGAAPGDGGAAPGTGGWGGAGGAGGAGGNTTDGGAKDGGFILVPTADPDAEACYFSAGSRPDLEEVLVCFGADPSPYQRYLQPGDAAVAPGQCPTAGDFIPVLGEPSCGYWGCGPLLPSAVNEIFGAAASDAGTTCCFVVRHICGV